jgi:hypothetical protein
MATFVPTTGGMASRAVCIAASMRDCLRAVQFYTRDMVNVDGGLRGDQQKPTVLSRAVARSARLADRLITWAANASIALFLPSWRNLPSPFSPGIIGHVADAIRDDRLLHNPLFNAYFFRAATRIVFHYAEKPNLVLEHRVDAARRRLAAMAAVDDGILFLARTLLILVEAKPVARIGASRRNSPLFAAGDANIPVFAIAITALLLAQDGKPMAIRDDDEFFSVIGALIQTQLGALERAIETGDPERVAQELDAIKSLY